MMKKLLICLPLLLMLTGCDCGPTYEVTSTITNKDEIITTWVQMTISGNIYIPIYHQNHYYYFYFNEFKEYSLDVDSGVFAKYNIGDIYTFTTNDNELDMYFYETSYHLIVEDGN